MWLDLFDLPANEYADYVISNWRHGEDWWKPTTSEDSDLRKSHRSKLFLHEFFFTKVCIMQWMVSALFRLLGLRNKSPPASEAGERR
jgi:hypothetical protein